MSNKTQLATNNTQLASLIQTLQGKAAGGGASVETCVLTVSPADSPSSTGAYVYYVDESQSQTSMSAYSDIGNTGYCVKNSIVVTTGATFSTTNEGASLVKNIGTTYVWFVTGDCYLSRTD